MVGGADVATTVVSKLEEAVRDESLGIKVLTISEAAPFTFPALEERHASNVAGAAEAGKKFAGVGITTPRT